MTANTKAPRRPLLSALMRLGVVTSIVWVVAGPIIYNSRIEAEAERTLSVLRHECLGVQDVFFDACLKDAQGLFESDMGQKVTTLEWAATSALCLAVALTVAYLIYLTTRWIIAGFRKGQAA